MAEPQTLFFLVAGVVLLLALGVLVHVSAKLGTAVFVVLAALWTNLRTPLAPSLAIGGLQVTALDVLAVVILVSGLVRATTGAAAGRRLWPLWLLVGILVLNAARGISHSGLQHPVDEVRSWLFLLAALVYGATSTVTDPLWWRRVLALYCGGLAVVTVVGLSGTGLGAATTRVQLDGKLVDPRPLTSFGALILADVLLILFAARLRRRNRSLAAMAVLAALLVLLQQRTVWIAGAISLSYVALAALRAGGRARLAAVIGAASVALVAATAFLTGTVQRSVIAASAENITQSDNTLAWRLEGWKQLLRTNLGLVQSVVGQPFGSGYRRTVAGTVVTVSPHSHYVEMFLRFGLIGSVAFVALAVIAWRGTSAAALRFGVEVTALRAILLALMVAGLTYRWDITQGLMLGTIIGSAGRGRPSPVSDAAGEPNAAERPDPVGVLVPAGARGRGGRW